MQNLANAAVSVLRGTSTDAYGDVTDAATFVTANVRGEAVAEPDYRRRSSRPQMLAMRRPARRTSLDEMTPTAER